MTSLAFGIMAYSGSVFSSIYSGRLYSNSGMDTQYMNITEADTLMSRIIYKAPAGYRFLTISSPDSVYFSKDHLYVTYGENNNGRYTTADGTLVAYVDQSVFIQTEDVAATFSILGKVKSVTVSYCGVDYTSKK